MDYNQALERAMQNYYGADDISSRVPVFGITKLINKTLIEQKEKQKMNQEQLESMTKKELNAALTPFTGGYTPGNLENRKKADLIDELVKHQSEATTKPKKKKSSSRGDLALQKDNLLKTE